MGVKRAYRFDEILKEGRIGLTEGGADVNLDNGFRQDFATGEQVRQMWINSPQANKYSQTPIN
jgi:hypothetical protein